MNERDLSLIKMLGKEVSVLLREAESRHKQELDAAGEKLQLLAERIKKLESDVDGLVSLLGED